MPNSVTLWTIVLQAPLSLDSQARVLGWATILLALLKGSLKPGMEPASPVSYALQVSSL